jgi:hypothetical protein
MRGNLGSLSYEKGSNPGGRPLVHVTVTLAQNGLYFQLRPTIRKESSGACPAVRRGGFADAAMRGNRQVSSHVLLDG